MKLLFSAYKATQRFISLQQYHLHGGSCQRFSHPLNLIGFSKPNRMLSSSLYSVCYYSTSTIPNSNKIENDVKKVDLEIISRETIKPSSPTPQHLRTFKLSILDQYMYDTYVPAILFLPNTNKDSVTDVVNKRSKRLKESLSEILTRFYPFAGKVMNNMQIECNDEGIYYMLARVNETLEDFLRHPDDERVRLLMPQKPCTEESLKGNCVMAIQVNIFNCGGIGISTRGSHKIIDGQTYYIFMKAWAAAARGLPETISPSFIASEIFPNNPCFEDATSFKVTTIKMITTKRFVFDSSALAMLKAVPVASRSSTKPPSRTEATSSVIWKAAAKAASKVRSFGPQSPHALLSVVNLRNRASPTLPKESIGNLVDLVGTICFPGGHLDLATMMGDLRDAIGRINSDHIESMKGEKGHASFNEKLSRSNSLMEVIAEEDRLIATSLLNNGMYELDFGMGKPLWFYIMGAANTRYVVLNDLPKGGCVEAIVTLSPDEMEIFERDSELLSYATINPSPLQFVH